MIEVSRVAIERKEDISSLCSYNAESVTQVLGFVPENVVLEQACFIFFRVIDSEKMLRIKNKSMIFLMLLTSSSQIKDALDSSRVKIPGENYLIRCIKCGIEKFEKKDLSISREQRMRLTFNSLTFS